uniref:peptidylprolyl isomerase n=1 Tax=Amphiprion ocellaris TaxID=80972 RepID=A0A3Q1CWY1_AMPOC
MHSFKVDFVFLTSYLYFIRSKMNTVTVENQVVPESCSRRSVVGDYIRYHYNGSFLNGWIFGLKYPFFFTVHRMGYIIAGMDQALQGVCIGERRRVTIPPHLAYGEQGAGKFL